MSTLVQTIKNEIRRISRREIGLALSNFRRDHIALKKRFADQKSRISAIEKENKDLSKKLAAVGQGQRGLDFEVRFGAGRFIRLVTALGDERP